MSNFLRTLEVLQDRLNSRLTGLENFNMSNTSRIRVDGCHKNGKTTFCFTIFQNNLPSHFNGYTIRFYQTKNLRMWRNEGDIEEENLHMNNLIGTIVESTLTDIIN